MSRAIRLTRLHAINWYGYRDSFDITGNLLIAGVTGSGKSVLMDLIQFVLIANQQRVRYNLSATGDRSTRDLKGYCLGDTKQDVDGVPQFMRNGGITYVALEFTWPDVHKPRIETWGLRIEFESATQSTPSVRSFLAPVSLRRDDFLDVQKYPLDFTTFRARIEQACSDDENPGRTFSGVEEYRREMALPTHLNFDRPTLDHILPAAMSFTFMDSFNEFCRRYILPAESLDIQSVKDSYLVFRNLQTELARLRDQQEQLERIHTYDQQRQAAERDRVVCRYLEAECRRDDARKQHKATAAKVADLESSLSEETVRLRQLTGELEAIQEVVRSIEATFNATEDGKLYRRILQENRELATAIDRLAAIGQSVEQARDLRVKNTAEWLEHVLALPFHTNKATLDSLRRGIKGLADATQAEFRDRTLELARGVKTISTATAEVARPTIARYGELEREAQALNAILTVLRAGTLSDNTVLLTALNRVLPRRTKASAAQALWQLCEVTDETWRPALEVAFTRKFAVVVDSSDYDQAERVYYELKENARGESLVNPDQALAFDRESQPNSLARKLEVPSGNSVARALVNHLFGDVVCVDSVDDLRDHPKAITRDGFMMQGPFVRRYRHYDNRPCIGQRGLEKQRAYLHTEIESRRAEQKQLDPALEGWRSALQLFEELRLGSESLHDDLAEATRLPVEKAKLDQNLAELKGIRSNDLAQKEEDLKAAQTTQSELRAEQLLLAGSRKRHTLETEIRNLETLKAELTAREHAFMEVGIKDDVSRFLARVDELRTEVSAEFPTDAGAAHAFHERFRAADTGAALHRANLVGARKVLATHPDYGTKYNDFDAEAATNDQYDERLNQIGGAHIREYETKAAAEERNWQELFREQVLEKLRERLLMVDNLMALLKAVLYKPIGNDRYTIKATPNRDGEFDMYRQLLELSAVARDGGLFATASSDVQEAVQRIFQSLTGESAGKDADKFLDYRNYFDYDIFVSNDRDPDARPYSVNRQAGKSSGGENQTPYFIAILASYLRAYRRHEMRRKEAALALVPIDEAFSKLSGERIRDCLTALAQLDLQGVFSMSTGNIPYAIDHCDQVIAVHKREQTKGRRTEIRNVAASLTRVEALERFSGGAR